VRLQPNRNYVSNDDIQTPLALARRLVQHFQPTGLILEPCAGDGHFLKALRSHARQSRPESPASDLLTTRYSLPTTTTTRASWTEIKRNRDFFAWGQSVDWIITNPPWSQIRRFLQHALSLADHVVFLFTINHLWTRARLSDVHSAGFGLKELVLVDTPKKFPPSGFQLGAVHLHRGWTGPVTLTDWTAPVDGSAPGAHGGRSDGEAAEAPDAELEEIREINRRLDALLAKPPSSKHRLVPICVHPCDLWLKILSPPSVFSAYSVGNIPTRGISADEQKLAVKNSVGQHESFAAHDRRSLPHIRTGKNPLEL
jgi:hypothetical protein